MRDVGPAIALLCNMRNFIRSLSISFFLLGLTACAQETTINTNKSNSSREAPPAPGIPTDPNAGDNTLTEYNGFSKNSLAGKIKTYYSPSGIYIAELVRLRLTSVPDGLNNARYVKFFRGFVDDNKSKYLDYGNPLKIIIEDPATGQPKSGEFDSLSKSLLAGLSPAIVPNDITKFNLILNGTTLNYEIIQMVLYDSNQQAYQWVDFLIPAFKVHPAAYAAVQPEIKELHPFYGMVGTVNEFLARADAFKF